MLGRAEQSARGRAHGRGTTADAGQEFLDIWTERSDSEVDCRAPLFLAADGGAFLLGMALLRYVLVRGDLAAPCQRLVLGKHDAAIACLHVV